MLLRLVCFQLAAAADLFRSLSCRRGRGGGEGLHRTGVAVIREQTSCVFIALNVKLWLQLPPFCAPPSPPPPAPLACGPPTSGTVSSSFPQPSTCCMAVVTPLLQTCACMWCTKHIGNHKVVPYHRILTHSNDRAFGVVYLVCSPCPVS